MKLHIYILILLLGSMLASCEKELDFKYHDIPPIPVIEGSLLPDGIKVGLTMTTPMDEPMDLTRLTDAEITLRDLTADVTYTLSPDESGYFTAPVDGVIGHSYGLKIERNGSIYEIETEMYGPTEILSLEFNWIKMPYDQVAVLQCKFADVNQATGDCYWVKLFRNGEIYRWTQTDDRGALDGVITFTAMTSRRDTDEEDDEDVLFDGDVVTCSVSKISKEMYDYLEALQNDSNGPAMFTGDMCLGYFMATSPVEKSIVFHPDEIPDYK